MGRLAGSPTPVRSRCLPPGPTPSPTSCPSPETRCCSPSTAWPGSQNPPAIPQSQTRHRRRMRTTSTNLPRPVPRLCADPEPGTPAPGTGCLELRLPWPNWRLLVLRCVGMVCGRFFASGESGAVGRCWTGGRSWLQTRPCHRASTRGSLSSFLRWAPKASDLVWDAFLQWLRIEGRNYPTAHAMPARSVEALLSMLRSDPSAWNQLTRSVAGEPGPPLRRPSRPVDAR